MLLRVRYSSRFRSDRSFAIRNAALASPAYCPAFSSEIPDDDALAARYLLSRWILHRSGVGIGADSRDIAEWADTRGSQDWVRASYLALAACRLDGLAPPPQLDIR